MPHLNQKGVAHVILLLVLLAGIVAGVYLVQQTQIFKPKAYNQESTYKTYTDIKEALVAYNNSERGKIIADVREEIDAMDLPVERRFPGREVGFDDPSGTKVEENDPYKLIYGVNRFGLLREAFDIDSNVPDNQLDSTIKHKLEGSGVTIDGNITGNYNIRLPEGCFEGFSDYGSTVICPINLEQLTQAGTVAVEFLFADPIQSYRLHKNDQANRQEVDKLFEESGVFSRHTSVNIDTKNDSDYTIYRKFYDADVVANPDDKLDDYQRNERAKIPQAIADLEKSGKAFKDQALTMVTLSSLINRVQGVAVSAGKEFFRRFPITPTIIGWGDRLKKSFGFGLSKEGEEVVEAAAKRVKVEESTRHLFPNIAKKAAWLEVIETPKIISRYFRNGIPARELEEVREQVIKAAAENLPKDEVLGIFVIGSQARGTATSQSDLDILILTNTLDFLKSEQDLIALNQATNVRLTPRQVADFFTTEAISDPEIKKNLVDVFVRTGGLDNAYDLVNSRWVKLDRMGRVYPRIRSTYSKYAEDSTTPVRFGKSYPGGGVEEFEALSRLYKVAPDNVVRPIELIHEGDKIIGYKMEYIEGITVIEFIERYGGLPERIKDQIIKTLQTFHENNLAHGDPNFGNVIITTRSTVKFIDPVPYTDFESKYAVFDLGVVNRALEHIKILEE